MQTSNSIGRIYRKVVLIVTPLAILYLIGSQISEYFRLPDNPSEMSIAESVALVEDGMRPLVQIVDIQWNCSNMVMRHGKRWVTNIALSPMPENILVIAHFWGKRSCEEIKEKKVIGVLEPMTSPVFNDLKRNGMSFGSFTSNEHVFNLCTYCNRQYSLWQVIQMVGYITIISSVAGIVTYIQKKFQKKPLGSND